MRVLIIPSWYVTEDKPINGIFFKEQAESLQDFGLDVVVAYPDLRFKLGGLRQGIFKDYVSKVPTYIYRKRSYTPFFERGRWHQRKKMLEELYQCVCRDIGEPDVIHLHSCRMGIEVLALCKSHKIPLVYTEHYSGILSPMSKDLKYQFERTLLGCSCPIAVSEDLRARMITKRRDTLFIPNLVDTANFKIMPNVETSGNFSFIALGGLIPIKGFDILLQAFAAALPRMPGARLNIAGSGLEEQNLKIMISELKLEDNAELSGFLPRAMAPRFYNGCDCYVCSSYAETFGVTLIEALSCGRPVIATRCGGPESIVNTKNGLLINSGDVFSMERALVYMYRNARNFNPFMLREDCVKRFGKSYVCQRLVQVYGHLLNQKRN